MKRPMGSPEQHTTATYEREDQSEDAQAGQYALDQLSESGIRGKTDSPVLL
jgi:hypothetical protein